MCKWTLINDIGAITPDGGSCCEVALSFTANDKNDYTAGFIGGY